MIIATQPNWTNWFVNHPSNDAGNRNLRAFSNTLDADFSNDAKLKDLIEENDTVILAADANKKLAVFHSPKNFGGTRTRPDNKVACLIGLGNKATPVILDLESALQSVRIRVPGVLELSGCTTAEEVAALAAPGEDEIIGMEGSAVYIPGPVLRNVIIEAASKDPFELIPLISQAAKAFDEANEGAKAVEHADDLCAWIYGVKAGLIPETRYSVDPDDAELEAYGIERTTQCITSNAAMTTRTGEAVALDGASVISQLTNALTIQNEYLGDANVINRRNQIIAEEREEKKKDRLKNKIYSSIKTMLEKAAASDRNHEDSEIAPSCMRFINAENAGLAQCELIHQFKTLKFEDVGFAAGTVQALYLGEFLYADSSSPSNFTVFAFFEQEPNAKSMKEDYLICHLIQEQGQKKSIDEIKASLKQTVHVPKDFNSMGNQLQIFAAASSIFFGKESMLTESLDQLVLLVGRNKKNLRDQIAIDEFFAAKFMLAVDRRVQRWLKMCENCTMTRKSVNDKVIDFEDLLEQVLNGSFTMNLPPSFKIVQAGTDAPNDAKQAVARGAKEEGKGEGRGKKRKGDNGNGNLVKNPAPDEDLAVKAGESWAEIFSKQLPKERPSWDGKINMCARWHIKGDCFDDCSRKESHVGKDKIPADKKASFLTYMAKCREAAKGN